MTMSNGIPMPRAAKTMWKARDIAICERAKKKSFTFEYFDRSRMQLASFVAHSAKEIGLGQVEYFVATTAEHRSDHVETETERLLRADGRWNRKLLAVDDHVNEGRTVMLKSPRQGGAQFLGLFDPHAKDAGGGRHMGRTC